MENRIISENEIEYTVMCLFENYSRRNWFDSIPDGPIELSIIKLILKTTEHASVSHESITEFLFSLFSLSLFLASERDVQPKNVVFDSESCQFKIKKKKHNHYNSSNFE